VEVERYKEPILSHVQRRISEKETAIERAKQTIELFQFSQYGSGRLVDQLKNIGFIFPDEEKYDEALTQKINSENELNSLNALLREVQSAKIGA
jgi:uncharacterized pyridoxal phosphate-containing UPF0001 family protein